MEATNSMKHETSRKNAARLSKTARQIEHLLLVLPEISRLQTVLSTEFEDYQLATDAWREATDAVFQALRDLPEEEKRKLQYLAQTEDLVIYFLSLRKLIPVSEKHH
jgi:hypothetical protein